MDTLQDYLKRRAPGLPPPPPPDFMPLEDFAEPEGKKRKASQGHDPAMARAEALLRARCPGLEQSADWAAAREIVRAAHDAIPLDVVLGSACLTTKEWEALVARHPALPELVWFGQAAKLRDALHRAFTVGNANFMKVAETMIDLVDRNSIKPRPRVAPTPLSPLMQALLESTT